MLSILDLATFHGAAVWDSSAQSPGSHCCAALPQQEGWAGLAALQFPHKFCVCPFLSLEPSSTEAAGNKIGDLCSKRCFCCRYKPQVQVQQAEES